MTVRFSVLGSGSAGNASLLEVGSFRLLIDAGLGPRQVASRLKELDLSWADIHAALLTHVHTDHWREKTLEQFVRFEIRLYLHTEHIGRMRSWSPSFNELESQRLIRLYDPTARNPVVGSNGLSVQPFHVSHDSPPTFGFRFEVDSPSSAPPWSMAYAADLGTWRSDQLRFLADVDLLALEFNHDVELQRRSGRPQLLIDRVLGDAGHLSNDQAGALLEQIAARTAAGRLRNVVPLHLSRQCNRPELAVAAAERALTRAGRTARIVPACQDRTTIIRCDSEPPATGNAVVSTASRSLFTAKELQAARVPNKNS